MQNNGERDFPEEVQANEKLGFGTAIAKHYNQLAEESVEERKECRIIHMRNLNNWIKSRLIGDTLDCIRQEKGNNWDVNVLDLACGKGGDLQKWNRGRVNHVVCADFAEKSIEQCIDRYLGPKKKPSEWSYTAEFITTDCSKNSVKDKLKDKDLKFDLVSCQFAIHYSFESLPQAEQMLLNVTSNLQPGGYFIGTTTDAYDIMRRLGRDKNPENRSFGNEIFRVEFPAETKLDPPPIFGAMYNFKLAELVGCPEFLVHFPTFEKLAAKYGLTLIRKERFEDFVLEEMDIDRKLFKRMRTLETYDPKDTRNLVGNQETDYEHVRQYLEEKSQQDNGYKVHKITTLTKSEWEAVSLYLLFVFRKMV